MSRSDARTSSSHITHTQRTAPAVRTERRGMDSHVCLPRQTDDDVTPSDWCWMGRRTRQRPPSVARVIRRTVTRSRRCHSRRSAPIGSRPSFVDLQRKEAPPLQPTALRRRHFCHLRSRLCARCALRLPMHKEARLRTGAGNCQRIGFGGKIRLREPPRLSQAALGEIEEEAAHRVAAVPRRRPLADLGMPALKADTGSGQSLHPSDSIA